MMDPFPLPDMAWLTLVQRKKGPPSVWSVSTTREEAESKQRGDLGGEPTTWLVECDRPDRDVWFRDPQGGPAWMTSRAIWFQRHAMALRTIAPMLGPPVPAWHLFGTPGEVRDPFQGHSGGDDIVFPWPAQADPPRCKHCGKALKCLSVLDGQGAPGWFTDVPGVLVVLICREHWYEDASRHLRWVGRGEPSRTMGSQRATWIHGYAAVLDHPFIDDDEEIDPEASAAVERLTEDRFGDFLVPYGTKLGGVPHWIQIDGPPPATRIWTVAQRGKRRQWRFIGQVGGVEGIDLGDSGQLYLWRDEVTGAFASKVQCY